MSINFPNSPTVGQEYEGFVFDGTAWISAPASTAGLPAGSIIAWSSNTAPANWLIADGSDVSRTTYASLYAAIGTQFGAGNGSTTFNLPNLKGRVPVGRDSSQTEFDVLGENGGEKTHTLTVAQMPSHSHTYSWGSGNFNAGSNFSLMRPAGFNVTNNSSSVGGNAPHNNLQPYQVVNYIIKFTNGDTAGDSQLTGRVGVLETQVRPEALGGTGRSEPIFGHMGRTAGFQTISSRTEVAMSAAQTLSGGVTRSGNRLVVPEAGLYQLTWKLFSTGGSGYVASCAIAVNGVDQTYTQIYKDNGNDYIGQGTVVINLAAGNAVSMYHGGGNTWGTNGYNGAYFEVWKIV